jgi:hypothetical protein
MVKARLDELRDPDLRSGYLEQPAVRKILSDGGLDPAASDAALS